jgi:hypothetical protein
MPQPIVGRVAIALLLLPLVLPGLAAAPPPPAATPAPRATARLSSQLRGYFLLHKNLQAVAGLVSHPAFGILAAASTGSQGGNFTVHRPAYAGEYPPPPTSLPETLAPDNAQLFEWSSYSRFVLITLLSAMDVNHAPLVARGHAAAKKSDAGHLRWSDKISKWIPSFTDSPYENATLDDVSMHRACFDDANLHEFAPTQQQKAQLQHDRAACYWPGPPQSCRRGELVSVRVGDVQGAGERVGAIVLNITKDNPYTRGLRMNDYPVSPDSIVHVDQILAADGSGTSCMTKIVMCQQQVTARLFSWVPPFRGCRPGGGGETRTKTRHFSTKILHSVLSYAADAAGAAQGLVAIPTRNGVNNTHHEPIWVQMARTRILEPLEMHTAFLIPEEEGMLVSSLPDVARWTNWLARGMHGWPQTSTLYEDPLCASGPGACATALYGKLYWRIRMNFWCDRDLDRECENACDGVMIEIKEETGQSVMASTIPFAVERRDCDGKIHGGNAMSWKQVAEQLRWLFWNQTIPIAMEEVGTAASFSSSGSDTSVTSVDGGKDPEEAAPPKDMALVIMAGSIAVFFTVIVAGMCICRSFSSNANAHTRLDKDMELTNHEGEGRGEGGGASGRASGDVPERYRDLDYDDDDD